MSKDNSFKKLTKSWFKLTEKYQYSYHFSWMGRPIIQYPQDIIALQEIICYKTLILLKKLQNYSL